MAQQLWMRNRKAELAIYLADVIDPDSAGCIQRKTAGTWRTAAGRVTLVYTSGYFGSTAVL